MTRVLVLKIITYIWVCTGRNGNWRRRKVSLSVESGATTSVFYRVLFLLSAGYWWYRSNARKFGRRGTTRNPWLFAQPPCCTSFRSRAIIVKSITAEVVVKGRPFGTFGTVCHHSISPHPTCGSNMQGNRNCSKRFGTLRKQHPFANGNRPSSTAHCVQWRNFATNTWQHALAYELGHM